MEDKMLYVVTDIGCIECGEESMIVGIYTDKAKADDVCEKAIEVMGEWTGGQHRIQVYESPGVDAEPNMTRD